MSIIDGFERVIDYARISVTDRCNLKCRYCMPEDGVQKVCHSEILSLEGLFEIAKVLNELGVDKIRVTGGEPLVRKGVMTLFNSLGKLPLKKLGITTNAVYLKENAKKLKDAGVNAINISLDTLDPHSYQKITRGGSLNDALEGFQAAKEHFQNIKINTVYMKGINDKEIIGLLEFAKKEGVQIRFIELMPFCHQQEFFDRHFLSLQALKDSLGGLDMIREEKIASLYKWKGYEFGLITPISQNFCSRCNRIRITAKGELLNCLHSEEGINLAPYIGDTEKLKKVISEHIRKKPKMHRLNGGEITKNQMGKIGG